MSNLIKMIESFGKMIRLTVSKYNEFPIIRSVFDYETTPFLTTNA